MFLPSCFFAPALDWAEMNTFLSRTGSWHGREKLEFQAWEKVSRDINENILEWPTSSGLTMFNFEKIGSCLDHIIMYSDFPSLELKWRKAGSSATELMIFPIIYRSFEIEILQWMISQLILNRYLTDISLYYTLRFSLLRRIERLYSFRLLGLTSNVGNYSNTRINYPGKTIYLLGQPAE